MFWSPQLKTALFRALLAGVVLGGATFFGALSGGSSYKAAGIAASVTFFGALIARGAVEGFVDTQTAKVAP